MKNSLKMLLAASLLSSAGLMAAAPASAAVGFSFRVGDVAMGYSDGYYDQSRHWHSWRNSREREWYHSHYRTSYRSMRHDNDHDGIPNRVDRDRDNDGVPNNRDDAPNNPYRH